MPFIILGDREQEWERRPLREAITIGRSFDCELPIRDTLLSRKHCRLEPHGNQWVLIDLNSRNGTRIGDDAIARHLLEDGDVIRIGQTQVCFRAGAFVPAKVPARISPRNRPMDPHEALAATLSGVDFSLVDSDAAISEFPIPQPKPTEPKAFQNEGVGMLVSKMASGVWDSRLAAPALNRRPTHVTPWENQTQPAVKTNGSRKTFYIDKDISVGHKPARWLVITYMFLAGATFAASLCAIAWPRM